MGSEIALTTREQAVRAIASSPKGDRRMPWSEAINVLYALESAGLEIVPANLLDAVIAAVDEAFCYNPVTKRSKIQVARTDVIAAIRAAWEGAMGESDN